MKKKLTLWIMLLAAVLLAQAQDPVQPRRHRKPKKVDTTPLNFQYPPVHDEVKPDYSRESLFKALFVGGMNFSQIDGDGEAGYRKYGAIVGGGTVMKFSRRFSVSVELLYSQKGSRPEFSTNQVTGVKNKFNITADYIDLPFTFSVHDKKTLMFGAGLQLSALARYQQTDTAGVNVTAHPPPNGEQLHRLDLLGQLCGTFFIKQRLGIGLRFAYSFLKIRDAVAESHLKGEYNNTLSLRISYLLDPKHVKWSSKIP